MKILVILIQMQTMMEVNGMIEDYNGDGDVNEDDILNIQDILIIIAYILNEIDLNLGACEAV